MFFCCCFTLSLYPWCVIHHAGCQILRGSLCKWNAKIMTCWYDRFFSDLSWKTVLCFSEPSLFWSCSSSVRSEEHEDRWGNHLQFAGFLAARRLQKCPTLSTELRQLQGRQSRGDGRMESLFWNLLCFLLLLIIVLPMSWSWESWIVIIWNDLLSWTRLLESPRQREDVYETKPKLRRVNLEQDGGDYWRRRRQASWLKVLHGEKEGGRQRQ